LIRAAAFTLTLLIWRNSAKAAKNILRNFLNFRPGIPDSDTFRRVFEKLNLSELSSYMTNWLSMAHQKRSVVAVDEKTICGSRNTQHKAYHVISAFAAESRITLGSWQ